MILTCAEIKETIAEEKTPEGRLVRKGKVFLYSFVLDSGFPQNSSYKAAALSFMSETRFKDIEPGESYTIKRLPFVTANNGNGKVEKEIINRIKEKVKA